jgi:Holliday junction DNA helicase RuvA
MISHLYGEISAIGDGFAVIDVGGVGYRINMTAPALQKLAGHTGKIRVFTNLIVREDALTLAGFLEQSELEVFLMLITVNRVGPQLGLSILSQIPADELVQAIRSEDEKRLTRISGVGPRNARRLILELKDRFNERKGGFAKGLEPVGGQVREDVAEALIALGFPSRESYEAVDTAAAGTGPAGPQALLKASLALLKEKRRL